ncbi:MAG: DNRLRE domain-containing protein, partial [Thermoleophilaceae bacterium]
MRRLAAGVALATALALTVGLAASLSGVSSQKLTVEEKATSVPTTMSCTASATADNYVSQSDPVTNFGSADFVEVRAFITSDRRTFVKFDVAGCSIPATATIDSATLSLYMHAAPGSSRTYQARRVTASWIETGQTWNNQPAVAGADTSTFSTGTISNVWKSADVKADVAAFVAGSQTNHGWRIK